MQTQRAERDTLSLSFTHEVERFLTLAAKAVGRSVTEFVRESSLMRAVEFLPDRTDFGLDAERWAACVATLDAAARELPRIRRLLRESGVFDPRETRQVPR
jgi:uncharacterized protein (DUF1778 family)